MVLEKPMDEVIAAMVRVPQIMARRMHREVIRPALEEVGVDFALHHIQIMKMLDDSGQLHVSEIGDMLGIARAQMTKSVDKLITLGMLEREADTIDRRKISIRLTKKGQSTVRRIDATIEKIARAKFTKLSNNELKRLADSYNYIADTYSKL